MSNKPAGQPPEPGGLIIISAPSGAGKTSLIRALLERDRHSRLSVSYTTRPARAGERDGVDYHFVTPDAFEQRRRRGGFLEHAVVFDHHYGTSQSATDALLAEGLDVILEIDWQGARSIRAARPGTPGIFILPPSLEALEQRLRQRGLDSEATIARRMAAAREEISHWPEFDYLLINDDFNRALDQLHAIVIALRCRRERIGNHIAGLYGPQK